MTDEKKANESYEAPEVEQIPTDSGPAVTAAGETNPPDGGGPEWRPTEKDQ